MRLKVYGPRKKPPCPAADDSRATALLNDWSTKISAVQRMHLAARDLEGYLRADDPLPTLPHYRELIPDAWLEAA